MESKVNKEMITFIVCITILLITLIASISVYNLNHQNQMSKNVESAIAKGIDPISVKCTYDQYSSATCITYSLKGTK